MRRWALLGLLALVTLEACDSRTQVVSRGGRLEFVASGAGEQASQDARSLALDFGVVPLEAETLIARRVQIRNAGDAATEILALRAGTNGTADAFRWPPDGQVATTLAPGAMTNFQISFAPTTNGAATLELTVSTKDDAVAALPLRVTLSGVASATECALSPLASIDFGDVIVGHQASRTLKVTNSGTLAWKLIPGGFTGADADEFSLGDGTALVLEPGEVRDLELKFKPVRNGPAHSALSSFGDGPCTPDPFPVQGNALPDIVGAAPDPVDFGYVDAMVPWGVIARTITLTNHSHQPVSLSSGRLCGDSVCLPTDEFASTPDGGSTQLADLHLAPGDSSTVQLYFRPSGMHLSSGTLTYQTDVPDQPSVTAQLRGTGGGPRIAVDPAALSFAHVAMGTPQWQFIQVRNAGSSATSAPDSALQLSYEVLPGAGTSPSEFEIESPDGGATAQLFGGEQVALRVTLAALSAGSKSATLRIHSNDPVSPQVDVPLTGEAQTYSDCHYDVTPSTLEFGLLPTGGRVVRHFTINNLGTAPGETCLISNLEIAAGSASMFSLPDGPILSEELPPGGHLEVAVADQPEVDTGGVTVQLSGAVSFAASSSTAPSGSVQLDGSVGTSCLFAAPHPADFGNVEVGCHSGPQSISLYDTCPFPVSVDGVRLVESGGARAGGHGCADPQGCPAFSIATGIPAGGLSLSDRTGDVPLQLDFAPVYAGADDGLMMVDLLQNGTVRASYPVPLHGQGVAGGTWSDAFTQGPIKVDVVFATIFVEESNFNFDAGTTLRNAARLFEEAQDAGIDFRTGMITTNYPWHGVGLDPDFAQFVPDLDGGVLPWLTPQTQDIPAWFDRAVSYRATGSLAMPFEGIGRAFSEPFVSTRNSGFLRANASLALVSVNENGDWSGVEMDQNSFGLEPWPVDMYFDELAGIKGANHLDMLTFNAVAFANDLTCTESSTRAVDNQRMVDMANLTGGELAELCDPNWSNNFAPLRDALFVPRTRFQLSGEPQPDSVQVRVNGASLANVDQQGQLVWSYATDRNMVTFAASSAPPEGSTIDIDYALACH